MLVLTRKTGESIVVGNSIRVKIIELSPGVVRLGIEAPPEISIYRDEVYQQVVEANRAALEEALEGSGK